MQVLYNSENVILNYWGAYTNLRIVDNLLTVTNTLNGKQITLFGVPEALNQLNELLTKGVEDELLIPLLESICGTGAFDVLLREGIIE